MAKIKELVDGAETKRPAKKKAKSTLSFTVDTETGGKEVTAVETISAKKEIVASEPKLIDSADILNDIFDAVPVSPKEPNLSTPVREDKTAAPVVKDVSPVEESTPKTKVAPISNGHAKTYAKPDPKFTKNFDKKANGKELPPAAGLYPEHMVNVALIIKNNAEIRRFTALGILNYLLQKGEIKGNKRFVSFKWNKFTVKCDNLAKDYSYGEVFFLNALAASFASFSASAQRTIDHFTRMEFNASISETLSNEEIDSIVESTSK